MSLLQVIILEWYTLSRWGSACWWRWGLYILLDGTACTGLAVYKRRVARFVLSTQHNRSSVTAMIQRLGWRSLEDRRRDARLTMLYKIDRELVAISKTDRLDRPTRRLWQSHDNAYQVPHCRIDVRKMSFFPRTVRHWNYQYYGKSGQDTNTKLFWKSVVWNFDIWDSSLVVF
jgi:hypothetical protein